jgi:hypothetical protein
VCAGVGRVKKGALEADRLLQKYTEDPEQILARPAHGKNIQWVMTALAALAALIVPCQSWGAARHLMFLWRLLLGTKKSYR